MLRYAGGEILLPFFKFLELILQENLFLHELLIPLSKQQKNGN